MLHIRSTIIMDIDNLHAELDYRTHFDLTVHTDHGDDRYLAIFPQRDELVTYVGILTEELRDEGYEADIVVREYTKDLEDLYEGEGSVPTSGEERGVRVTYIGDLAGLEQLITRTAAAENGRPSPNFPPEEGVSLEAYIGFREALHISYELIENVEEIWDREEYTDTDGTRTEESVVSFIWKE
ncbi:MAG: hypothetical protein QGG50_00645 [Methanopyri archaeon]|jgi:hypothetical protein|nr:hypothetical protein [Methanopyri archaeon]